MWKVEQKLAENFSFALLLFCKGIESKKKYQVKKKNVPPFLRGIGVTVDEIEIPCFRRSFGAGKRSFFQIFVFWAGLQSAF